tara:strand:- start:2161 stop:3669 length:1509 start_codon:yes stop_codon:yes gene_type:complete
MGVRRLGWFACLLSLTACFGDAPRPAPHDVGAVSQGLSGAAARRARAGQIRDAAFAEGIEQGWLLAGVASAETLLSHCASEYSGQKCYGPNSSDCGGGPVLAGYWDGPCGNEQGGLGMFQFDAGTYAQTLAREGNRILSVAGNVQAAIDFVISRMIYRSGNNGIPASGISNRDQAVAWMNGVRPGNARFAKWVEFITKYYNGCVSCSDYSNRYARYRDHATNIYDEMGASFWAVNNDWAASFVSQSFPFAAMDFEVPAGTEIAGYIELRNEGAQTWTPGSTYLGTTEPRDGASPLAASDWENDHRPASVESATAPGAVGRFAFSVRAPDELGDYPQYFNLVQEGEAWFSSPPDNQLQIRVTSVANECGAVGAAWECTGTMRQRCSAGGLEVETCPMACVDGECVDGFADADGDGHNTSVDCDDTDADIHPGAEDPCGDGVDSNCDGVDECGAVGNPDGGLVAGGDGSTVPATELSGGCAAGGRGTGFAGLLLLGLALIRRRR